MAHHVVETSAIENKTPAIKAHHAKSFHHADTNRNGVIDKDELLAYVDSNKDGEVNKEEFKKIAQNEQIIVDENQIRPTDVAPLLWNIYNLASIVQPIVFICFYVLMLTTVRPIVLDRGTFAFNNILINTFIEAPWNDPSEPIEKHFSDIGSVDEVWLWMKNVAANAIVPKSTTSVGEAVIESQKEYGAETIDGVVVIFTPPEVMQHRSKYAALPFHAENTYNHLQNKEGESWMGDIQSCPSFECRPFCKTDPGYTNTGKPSVSYDGVTFPSTGYYLHLPWIMKYKNASGTQPSYAGQMDGRNKCVSEALSFFEKNSWVDQSTRLVQVSICASPFTSTASTFEKGQFQDSVACMQMQFYINRYGIVTPKYVIMAGTAFGNDAYRRSQESIYLCICILPAVAMLIFEFNEILVRRFKYFSFDNIWNLFDLAISILSLNFAVKFKLDVIHANEDIPLVGDESRLGVTMAGLTTSQSCRVQYGWIMFMMTLRLVKFISPTPRMELPILTLIKALQQSTSMLLFLFIWATAMAIQSNGMFGDSMDSFSTIQKSGITVLRTWIGDIDFDQFADTPYESSGVIYMVLFGCLTMYILFTMFVSIIDEAYNAVLKNVLDHAKLELETPNYTYAEKMGAKIRQISTKGVKIFTKEMQELDNQLEEITDNEVQHTSPDPQRVLRRHTTGSDLSTGKYIVDEREKDASDETV
jgi:hypothetical protein